MKTPWFHSIVAVGLTGLAVACATPPSEGAPEDGDESSAAASSNPADSAQSGAQPTSAPATSTGPTTSTAPAVPPLPGLGSPPAPGAVIPGTPAAPINPVQVPPAAPPAGAANTCYAQCLATKGAPVNAFDACQAGCGEGDDACTDQCWTASGCADNETECQDAYATCDAECPGDLG